MQKAPAQLLEPGPRALERHQPAAVVARVRARAVGRDVAIGVTAPSACDGEARRRHPYLDLPCYYPACYHWCLHRHF